MPHDMLAVLLDQLGFALPNGLEDRFKLCYSVEVFRKQGNDFVVMDRHKLGHCSLDVFQKFDLDGAFRH